MSVPAAITALPYRPCVGVVLIGPDGRIFGGQRIDSPGPAWQMPQGGIDEGEAPAEAALRELHEETGVAPALAEILAESRGWHDYDLPLDLVPRLWGGRFRGQRQKWFALRFLGRDADIDIARPHPEFSRWGWFAPEALVDSAVVFKRDIYRRIFDEFAPLLRA